MMWKSITSQKPKVFPNEDQWKDTLRRFLPSAEPVSLCQLGANPNLKALLFGIADVWQTEPKLLGTRFV